MYIFAKVHPELDASDNPGNFWLNKAEREQEIQRFYEQKAEIPLDLNHTDIGRYGLVPHKNRVGRIVDLFNNAEGELMMKAHINLKHANSDQIKQWMSDKQRPLGVSPGVCNTPQGTRHLVHVALTQDPAFSRYGTYVDSWAINEKDLDRQIAHKYYREEPQQFYTHDTVRERLKNLLPPPKMSEEPQQQQVPQQQQQQQQQAMEVIENSPVPQQQQQLAAQVRTPPQFVGRPLTDLASLEEYQNEWDYMNNHMREHKLSYLDMDDEFQDKWGDLKKKIREEERVIEEYITQMSKVTNKFQSEKLCRVQAFMKEQTGPDDFKGALQTVVCASRIHHERQMADQQQKHNSELAQVKEELQTFKQQQQQDWGSAKRARTNDGAPMVKTTTTTTTMKTNDPSVARQNLLAPQQQQPRTPHMFASTSKYFQEHFIKGQTSQIATPSHTPAPQHQPLFDHLFGRVATRYETER